MQSALECTICFEEYDLKAKKPMLLPCTHGYCLECVKNLHKKGQIECAICKKVHKVAIKNIGVNQQLLSSIKNLSGKSAGHNQEEATCKKFAAEYLNNDIDQARAILLAYDWNYDEAVKSLNGQHNKF